MPLVLTLLSHGCPPPAMVAAFGLDDRTVAAWLARHDVVELLITRGADVNARTKYVPPTTSRTYEGTTPEDLKPGQATQELSSGLLTPLMFAAGFGRTEEESHPIELLGRSDEGQAGGRRPPK